MQNAWSTYPWTPAFYLPARSSHHESSVICWLRVVSCTSTLGEGSSKNEQTVLLFDICDIDWLSNTPFSWSFVFISLILVNLLLWLLGYLGTYPHKESIFRDGWDFFRTYCRCNQLVLFLLFSTFSFWPVKILWVSSKTLGAINTADSEKVKINEVLLLVLLLLFLFLLLCLLFPLLGFFFWLFALGGRLWGALRVTGATAGAGWGPLLLFCIFFCCNNINSIIMMTKTNLKNKQTKNFEYTLFKHL